eukprot:1314304-Rhodomonas_salina.2
MSGTDVTCYNGGLVTRTVLRGSHGERQMGSLVQIPAPEVNCTPCIAPPSQYKVHCTKITTRRVASVSLRSCCYACPKMPAYQYTSATRCPVLTWAMLLLGCAFRFGLRGEPSLCQYRTSPRRVRWGTREREYQVAIPPTKATTKMPSFLYMLSPEYQEFEEFNRVWEWLVLLCDACANAWY